ncbi:MAG: hypothetical protein IT416_01860 [Candidatus Pacebacteria bacterium]|nr:hypothetical protein [Candidatus Paceibacterota bacterium]
MLAIFVQLIFIFLFLRQIVIVLLAIWTYNTGDAPFRSTELSVIKDLVTKYKINQDETIYDLGSGSGSATFALAKYLPRNNFISIEKNLLLHLLASFRKNLRFDKKRFYFLRADLFMTSLRKAKIIYLYMSDRANRKLKQKLEKELKKETIILALRFKFESKKFKLVKTIETKYPLYIYKKIS